MNGNWRALVVFIGLASGAAIDAQAVPLSIVDIQAVGPGSQHASGPTAASTGLGGSISSNSIEASIADVHGLVYTYATSGPESFISDLVRISTLVTISDPSFPDCAILCPYQIGANLVLTFSGVAGGSGSATATASGSTGLNGTGVVIPFAFDLASGGPNVILDETHSSSTATRLLPLGTYFLNIQIYAFLSGPGLLDFEHSFHARIEPADGVTVTEVTGLMPIGSPVSSVPEPQTLALLLAGLGLLGLKTRRAER